MEPEKQQFSLKEWIQKHPKAVFAIRCFFWVLFACVLPFAFIAWRYDIFTSASKLKLTGWGFIAIIIVVVFIISLIKYLYQGMKPGIFKQCVNGFAGIILPLLVLLLLVTSIGSNVDLFKQALGCTILCEAIAIPFNPFPAWLEKRAEERGLDKAEKMSDILWNNFFKRKDGDK